jgi:hypothetical protein
MNFQIIHNCILIAGFSYFAFIPFDKKHLRARWAKSVFVICAIVGIAKGAVGLAWDLGWFALGSESGRQLNNSFLLTDGLLLGFIFSLILSGELTGTKQSAKQPSDTTMDSK